MLLHPEKTTGLRLRIGDGLTRSMGFPAAKCHTATSQRGTPQNSVNWYRNPIIVLNFHFFGARKKKKKTSHQELCDEKSNGSLSLHFGCPWRRWVEAHAAKGIGVKTSRFQQVASEISKWQVIYLELETSMYIPPWKDRWLATPMCWFIIAAAPYKWPPFGSWRCAIYLHYGVNGCWFLHLDDDSKSFSECKVMGGWKSPFPFI